MNKEQFLSHKVTPTNEIPSLWILISLNGDLALREKPQICKLE